MKRRSFSHGVIVALVLALLSSVCFVGLYPTGGIAVFVQVMLPVLCFIYIVYLLATSQVRVGRWTTMTLWGSMVVVVWWMSPSPIVDVAMHAGALWLVRSLYTYARVLPALMDLALTLFGLGFAVWAIFHTGSVFLTVWCFFLAQALFVLIPKDWPLQLNKAADPSAVDSFNQARRKAESALRQLATR